jgi:hypothetical protein
MRCIVLVLTVAGLLSALTLGGCAMASFAQIGPQSHFDFPNSNVKALGPVKVKVPGRTTAFIPPLPKAEDDVMMYNVALAQVEGANIITDYIKIIRIYGLGPIYWSEYELEGTAAKMEVGQRDLK